MHGSNFTRLLRLIKYFSKNLDKIPLYLKTSINNNVTPLDLELPWISYEAIDFLETYLKKAHMVAEYGGGGSTLFFAKRVNKVLCIESDFDWAAKISAKIKEQGISNVDLRIHPYDANDRSKFKESDYLHAIDGEKFDLILVDAYDKLFQLRLDCFYHAENFIRENGCIVVDDSFRYPVLRRKNKAKMWKEFRSIGPCRTGVTTTDVFFY